MRFADYSECPLQEVVADVKRGWYCTERCRKVLIPYFQQVSVQFQNRLVGSRSACLF